MILGIDIDSTLTDDDVNTEFIIKTGNEFFKKEPVKIHEECVSIMFDVSKEEEDRYWELYGVEFIKQSVPRDGLMEFAKQIHFLQIPYIIITNRCDGDNVASIGTSIKKRLSEQFITKYFGPSKIIFNNEGSKLNHILRNHIDIMMEDSVYQITELSKACTCIKMPTHCNMDLKGSNIIAAENLINALQIIKILKPIYDVHGGRIYNVKPAIL